MRTRSHGTTTGSGQRGDAAPQETGGRPPGRLLRCSVALGIAVGTVVAAPLLAAGVVPVTRVSVSSAEGQANGHSYDTAMSADGRLVAFSSEAENLVAGTHPGPDVFVRDRQQGTTVLVSSAGGVPGNGASTTPSISADGRYVAFQSLASNLVAGDTNAAGDAFVKNLQTGTVRRVSLNRWAQIPAGVTAPQITANGKSLIFNTTASLDQADTATGSDIYLRSLDTGEVELVSHATSLGRGANGFSAQASGNGRYVAYRSDTEGPWGGPIVWLRDTVLNSSRDLYAEAGFTHSDDYVDAVAVSADGRWVAFATDAAGRPEDLEEDEDVWFYDTTTGAFSHGPPSFTPPIHSAGPGALALSGDGRLVIYAGGFEEVVQGIWAYDRRTGVAVKVTETPWFSSFSGGRVASASASGEVFAFSSPDVITAGDTNGASDVYVQSMPDCTITGTSGNDVLTGTAGSDVICGMGGDDTLKGQAGDDLLAGGAGTDKVDYANATSGVTANLTTGVATGQGMDTLTTIEGLDGSPHADRLDGNEDANLLAGRTGNDSVYGQAGDDSVWGGDGNDTVGAGSGNDRIAGGPGVDTVRYASSRAAVNVDLTLGQATEPIGDGHTWVDILHELENVIGSGGYDRLRGNGLANEIRGGSGNDTILGEGANDRLFGWSGNDSLTGGAGTDACDGGADTDTAATCETNVSIP